MNAGGVPNTCKSSDLLRRESGGRVSNAWVTCPVHTDNLPKGMLIRDNMLLSHGRSIKAFAMNGRKLYVRPPTTAAGVRRSVPPGPSRPTLRSNVTSVPWSPRIVFQASVRIRKLVKNGTTTRPSSRFFHRPPRNAMTYASGYAMTSASSVAATAYTKEWRNCSPKLENAVSKLSQCQLNTGSANRLGDDDSDIRPSV